MHVSKPVPYPSIDLASDGHLPIAYGGDIFTLSVSRNAGCVYFWDHESDTIDNDARFVESDGHPLAGSFEEFLTRTATFDGP